NTSFFESELVKLDFDFENPELNVLWVGRYRRGKNIERLIEIARRHPKVNVRIIGVGVMEVYSSFADKIPNLTVLGPAFGDELREHYRWCHAVFNPGGAGLIVMNTARYGRPIVIDEHEYHGP